MKQFVRDILINENIILQVPSRLDIQLPSDVRVLLLDGILRENNAKQNSTLEETLKACTDDSLSLAGKLLVIQQILPITEDKFHKGGVIKRLLNVGNGEASFTPIELVDAVKEIQEIIEKKNIQPNSHALWSSVEFRKEEEMSMECFKAILEHSGNPEYIIVSNYFVYEQLPSEGKPKDIPTSEGIVEAWEIDGVTIFYMPLQGNMSDEDIILWHNVLTEIFK
jgi:hypothetical protein